jgi:hypothetical protein
VTSRQPGVGLLAAGAVTHRVDLDAAGVMIVLLSLVWGGGQLAAVRGQGSGRAFLGGDQYGDGHQAPVRGRPGGPG